MASSSFRRHSLIQNNRGEGREGGGKAKERKKRGGGTSEGKKAAPSPALPPGGCPAPEFPESSPRAPRPPRGGFFTPFLGLRRRGGIRALRSRRLPPAAGVRGEPGSGWAHAVVAAPSGGSTPGWEHPVLGGPGGVRGEPGAAPSRASSFGVKTTEQGEAGGAAGHRNEASGVGRGSGGVRAGVAAGLWSLRHRSSPRSVRPALLWSLPRQLSARASFPWKCQLSSQLCLPAWKRRGELPGGSPRLLSLRRQRKEVSLLPGHPGGSQHRRPRCKLAASGCPAPGSIAFTRG